MGSSAGSRDARRSSHQLHGPSHAEKAPVDFSTSFKVSRIGRVDFLRIPTKARQISISENMAPRKRSAVDDSSSEEEINVDKMVGTKKELDKVSPPRALRCI